MPQLRSYRRRHERAGGMSGVRASAGVFRASRGKLLKTKTIKNSLLLLFINLLNEIDIPKTQNQAFVPV